MSPSYTRNLAALLRAFEIAHIVEAKDSAIVVICDLLSINSCYDVFYGKTVPARSWDEYYKGCAEIVASAVPLDCEAENKLKSSAF